MLKHTQASVQIIRQLLQELKNDGLLTGAEVTDEVVKARLFDMLGNTGFSEKEATPKTVTILISDIRGFSGVVESYPAVDVVTMLNRYFNCMGDIISRYGGTIDKIMGDSMLMIFGLPKSRADDTQRAIACAIEMQMAMPGFNNENQANGLPSLYVGIGINTGPVMVAELGSKHYSEFTVIGSGVNLTSRIEAHSLRGQILISENTYELAKNFIKTGDPDYVEMKGTGKSVKLYELHETSQPRPLVVPRYENRKSPRARIKFPLEFQCLSDNTVLPQKQAGEAIDIGYNGLQLECDVELGKFSEIKLLIPPEHFDGESPIIFARIVNTYLTSEKYRCNMEFTSVNNEGQLAIKKLVDQLQENTLAESSPVS